MLLLLAVSSLLLGFLVFDLFMFSVRSSSLSYDETDSRKVKEAGLGLADSDRIRKGLERVFTLLPVPQQTKAIALKDITSLLRDRAQALQLILYGGVAVAYLLLLTFMSKALQVAPSGVRAWLALLSTLNVLFGGFIVTALMTRLVYPSISLEGKAFWILDSAPISNRSILRSKFFCWLPFTVVIATTLLLLGVSITGPSTEILLSTILIAISLSIGCTGLAIGIGACFATFEWESANQISAGLGTLVLLFSSLAFVLLISICSGITLFILRVPEAWNFFGFQKTLTALLGSLLLIPLLSVVIAKVAQKKGAESLDAVS